MRILHISTRLILGGSQENTVLSCEGQARLGHDAHLAFGPIYGPEGSLLDRVQNFRTPDGRPITTHVIPHLVRPIHPWADLRCYVELKRLIARLRPDVVHTHSSKAGIIGRAAAFALRDPPASAEGVARPRAGGGRPAIIHTVHGPPFMPAEGGPLSRLKTRVTNHAYVLAERFAARRCDTIVSVADAMTDLFLSHSIGRPEQYVTVRSGMEVEPFLHPRPGESRDEMRRALGLADADFVLGTVARLARHKGHDDLLDALAGDFRANPRWKLLWVGDGWWRERLAAKARSLGFSVSELDRTPAPSSAAAQVLITGLLPPERIPAHIRAMDALAHPSYREGLPRTVPQALLCNVCPVAYDADGTGEVCRDMETGRLVRVGDLAGLREAVRWCAANPLARTALAARGRAECLESFSAAAMVASLDRVYEAALAST